MNEQELAVIMTAIVVSLETQRRFGSHTMTPLEIELIASHCKNSARLVSKAFTEEKKVVKKSSKRG